MEVRDILGTQVRIQITVDSIFSSVRARKEKLK